MSLEYLRDDELANLQHRFNDQWTERECPESRKPPVGCPNLFPDYRIDRQLRHPEHRESVRGHSADWSYPVRHDRQLLTM